MVAFFFFQAEDGIRDLTVTGVQTCALPIFAGPRMRTFSPSCGEKYWESWRDQRIALSRLVSRTITLAREVNGGEGIIRRKCRSRSQKERDRESKRTYSRHSQKSYAGLCLEQKKTHKY